MIAFDSCAERGVGMTWLAPSCSWHARLHLYTCQVPSTATATAWEGCLQHLARQTQKLKGVAPAADVDKYLQVTSLSDSLWQVITGRQGPYKSWQQNKQAAIRPLMNEPRWLLLCLPWWPLSVLGEALWDLDPQDAEASVTRLLGWLQVASDHHSVSSWHWRRSEMLGLSVY